MDQKQFDKDLQIHIKSLLEISWEYIYNDKNLDNIYIYCLLGQNKFFNTIYEVKDQYFAKHKINLIDDHYLVTDERQQWLIKNSVNERELIESLFEKYKREIPFEVKIIYSPKNSKLDVKFSYDDPVKNEDSAIGDGFRNWIKSLGITM